MYKEPEMVRVEFTKSQPPYHATERARRTPKDAIALVTLGVAKFIDPPPGLDEFGESLEEKAAAKTASKPKPEAKAKAKAKPKGKRK
jgi:hypothetical protein